MNASLIVIGSEIALALYPILIKTVPTGLVTQLLSRFLTFSVLAAVLAKPSALYQTWGTLGGVTRSGMLGLLTLVHVATSYTAFEKLPAGVSMSLFYTYPIWNLIGGILGFGESVGLFEVGLILLAFLGTVLVSIGSRDDSERPIEWTGIAAALAAAITETGMYFAVRTAKQADPYYATLELYPGALFGLLGVLWLRGGGVDTIDRSPGVWGKMLLFNSVIGFLGYTLRFYAIPKLPTPAFSLLSFVGVVASFIWGWIFVEERPNLFSISGAALISLASAFSGKV